MFEYKLEYAKSTLYLINELAAYIKAFSKDTLTPIPLVESNSMIESINEVLAHYIPSVTDHSKNINTILTSVANKLKNEDLIFTYSLETNVVWTID